MNLPKFRKLDRNPSNWQTNKKRYIDFSHPNRYRYDLLTYFIDKKTNKTRTQCKSRWLWAEKCLDFVYRKYTETDHTSTMHTMVCAQTHKAQVDNSILNRSSLCIYFSLGCRVSPQLWMNRSRSNGISERLVNRRFLHTISANWFVSDSFEFIGRIHTKHGPSEEEGGKNTQTHAHTPTARSKNQNRRISTLYLYLQVLNRFVVRNNN